MTILVISGGGLNGYTFLGVLQKLFETGRLSNVEQYIGTSVGSILCYLLVIGWTPIDILTNVSAKDGIEELFAFNFKQTATGIPSFFSFERVRKILEKMTEEHKIPIGITFEHLFERTGKKLVCVAHNYTRRTPVYLSHLSHQTTPVIDALEMSCSVPGYFSPVKLKEEIFVDGFVSDPFPVEQAIEGGGEIIGLTIVEPETSPDDDNNGHNPLKFFHDILFYPFFQIIKAKIEKLKTCKSRVTLYCCQDCGLLGDICKRKIMDMYSEGWKLLPLLNSNSVVEDKL